MGGGRPKRGRLIPIAALLAASLAGAVLLGFDPFDVTLLADDALGGRHPDTAGSVAAQDYLIDELQTIAMGLNSSQTGDAAFKQAFFSSDFGLNGTNILAVIQGSELPDEYVVVGAHHDHLGSFCTSLQPGDFTCNGATDNAAGVAAVLAIGRAIAALPAPPRRSVILAFWDLEEYGLLGSQYYVDHPLVPLSSIITYVNYDIQGANLLPSLRTISLAVGGESGRGPLADLLEQAIAGEGLDMRRLGGVFGQGRSDYVAFANAGVPIVFFTDATGPCYHTSEDEVEIVDFGKLEKQSTIGFKLALALADTDTIPTFRNLRVRALFSDAEVLSDIIDLGVNDLGLFSPTDQSTLLQIQSDLNTLVAAGPEAFSSEDSSTVIFSAANILDILAGIDCDGFLTPKACSDGIDNDGDGEIDFGANCTPVGGADCGCASAEDDSEWDETGTYPCDDGFDNDGDDLADFGIRPGCFKPAWPAENPACSDGEHNDFDGLIDFDGGAEASQNGSLCIGSETPYQCCTGSGTGCNGSPDPECVGKPYRNKEKPGCGLGLELALLLPGIAWLGRRRTCPFRESGRP